MALRNILYDMFSHVEIHTYNDIENYVRDSNRHFVHFFVSSEMLFAHSDEFETLKDLTTVLSAGPNENITRAGFHLLDISHTEQEIVNGILLNVQSYGHRNVMMEQKRNAGSRLSPREKEVLTLMVKGFINKEIADLLNISITTVISHRKNIMEKLHARSLANVIIYAVMMGIVDIAELK